MARLAKDIMTPKPACCTPETTVEEVARMMVRNDCGEIPVLDNTNRVIGVVTDRDIVCRIVAAGRNPMGLSVRDCMSQPVVTIRDDASLDEVMSAMEKHQIRRVPVVTDGGTCAGIISQADLARTGPERKVAELLNEVSQKAGPAVH